MSHDTVDVPMEFGVGWARRAKIRDAGEGWVSHVTSRFTIEDMPYGAMKYICMRLLLERLVVEKPHATARLPDAVKQCALYTLKNQTEAMLTNYQHTLMPKEIKKEMNERCAKDSADVLCIASDDEPFEE
jgi:hypothetical protein